MSFIVKKYDTEDSPKFSMTNLDFYNMMKVAKEYGWSGKAQSFTDYPNDNVIIMELQEFKKALGKTGKYKGVLCWLEDHDGDEIYAFQ